MSFQNDSPFFASSSKISPHSSVALSHTIEGYNRRIQVGRLPVQGTCLGLVNQPVIEGLYVINSRWLR